MKDPWPLLVLTLALGGGAALEGCNPRKPGAPPGESAKPIYYCPMHPAITSDKPGDCPVCNMALELKSEGAGAAESPVPGQAVVKVSPEMRQLIGVKIETVERKPVKKTIRTVGRVLQDERRISAVSLRVGGWVEELHLKALINPAHGLKF